MAVQDHASGEIRPLRLLPCVAAGLIVWLLPTPEGLGDEAWRTFAVFIGVVLAFLLRPLPMGPAVLLGLLVLIGTTPKISVEPERLEGPAGDAAAVTDARVEVDTLEFALGSEGLGNTTVWLVVVAFLLAGAVERTGLGHRIALTLIRRLGRSLLGLGYAIAGSELILAPVVPSNTARGGGILSPIVRSLAIALRSRPDDESRHAGAFLVQTGAHANLVSASMFLTAMAGNTILPGEARKIGVEWTWARWAAGSIVPGLVAMACVPLVVRLLERRARVDVRAAHRSASAELAQLGAWSRNEIVLGVVLLVLLALWILSKPLGLGLGTTTVAFFGVIALVLSRAQTWRELVGTWQAWDALAWLGGFVALSSILKATGFVAWFGELLADSLRGGDPFWILIVLALVYFATMYLFTQLTAHISALAGIFFFVAADVGSAPLLAVALISYFSCICGLTTPWSSGPVIIYFGFGYVSVVRWMLNGLVAALVQIAVWLGVGLLWWKLLGWW